MISWPDIRIVETARPQQTLWEVQQQKGYTLLDQDEQPLLDKEEQPFFCKSMAEAEEQARLFLLPLINQEIGNNSLQCVDEWNFEEREAIV